MQGITEIGIRDAAQPTVISAEDLKALLYLTIRGQNGLAPHDEKPQASETGRGVDADKGVDVEA